MEDQLTSWEKTESAIEEIRRHAFHVSCNTEVGNEKADIIIRHLREISEHAKSVADQASVAFWFRAIAAVALLYMAAKLS
jgi:hypothetical protein